MYSQRDAHLGGFETALALLKTNGDRIARACWKPGKWIELCPATETTHNYLMLAYDDGRKGAPWTPSRCDMLENDWYLVLLSE